MKRITEIAIGVMVAGVLGTTAYYLIPEKKSPGQVLKTAIEKGEFEDGWRMTGDSEGAVCHMVIRRLKDGTDEIWLQHNIPARDFRTGSPAEHREWIKLDTMQDVEELGIACGAPDPFFRPAYAPPPYCENCGGGGCVAKNCSATTHPIGPCTLSGATCTITYFCCDWPCAGWPPC